MIKRFHYNSISRNKNVTFRHQTSHDIDDLAAIAAFIKSLIRIVTHF